MASLPLFNEFYAYLSKKTKSVSNIVLAQGSFVQLVSQFRGKQRRKARTLLDLFGNYLE